MYCPRRSKSGRLQHSGAMTGNVNSPSSESRSIQLTLSTAVVQHVGDSPSRLETLVLFLLHCFQGRLDVLPTIDKMRMMNLIRPMPSIAKSHMPGLTGLEEQLEAILISRYTSKMGRAGVRSFSATAKSLCPNDCLISPAEWNFVNILNMRICF